MADAQSNKLLQENIKLQKEAIVQAEAYLKTIGKGSSEYKKQLDKLKDLKKELTELTKNTEKANNLAEKLKEIEKERADKTKEVNSIYLGLNKREQKSVNLYGAITSLSQGVAEKLKFASSLQAGMTRGGQDLTKVYDTSAGKLNTIGNLIGGTVGLQDEAADLALRMAENYEKMGTSDFQDMSSEVDALQEKTLKKRNEINAMLSAGNYPKELESSLREELKILNQATNALDLKNTQYNRTNTIANEASSILTKPFDMMKSTIESLPFGGLASQIIELDKVQSEFTSGIAKSMSHLVKEYMATGRVNQLMVNNIKGQITKAMDGLKQGFSQLNAITGGMIGPILAIGAALFVAKKAVDLFLSGTMDTRKELGITTLEAAKLSMITNTAAMQFKLLGVSAEDVQGITKGIQENLGGVGQITQETVTSLASLNANFGIAGEDSSKLLATMMAVGSASESAAISQLESVGHLARQNGVAPSAVISDMASDMDTFASFARDGGKNLAMAAISARKLGIDMATVSKISESLLSFEESINAQMEAQVLTGKNINTDKARELALAGDLDGMQREITKQIGTASDFEAMNVVQRKALADAFGVSVGELSKMVTNQDKLNSMTETEKKRRDLIAKIMEELGKLGTVLLGSLKPMIPLVIGLLSPFIAIAGAVAGVLILFGKVLQFLNKLNVAGIGLGDVLMFAAGGALLLRTNLLGGGLMAGLSKMKDLIMGMGSGLKGMAGKIGGGAKSVVPSPTTAGGGLGESLAKGGKGMGAGLQGLSKGLGAFANPKVLGVLAALTVALIGVGFALKLAAPGIKAFGEAMGTIIKSVASGISTIVGSIGDFAVKLMTIASPSVALGLFSTAAGFTALAGSMAVFAGAGLLALPALLALTAFNAVTGAGGGGEGENTTDTLLKEQITELKKMNAKLDMVTSNTKKGADEARSLNSSVIMA